MKVASYLATRPGIQGIANRCIRLRFGGEFWKDGVASHTEVVFMPGDGVDHLMPDGTCEPNEAGEYWCASSAARERLPEWSRMRAGKTGGVRFKRINLSDTAKWEVREFPRDPLYAAQWYIDNEGTAYDWGMAFGFFLWPIAALRYVWLRGRVPSVIACSQSSAAAGQYARPDFFHPELVRSLLHWHQAENLYKTPV
jgi:hypothetical protein